MAISAGKVGTPSADENDIDTYIVGHKTSNSYGQAELEEGSTMLLQPRTCFVSDPYCIVNAMI